MLHNLPWQTPSQGYGRKGDSAISLLPSSYLASNLNVASSTQNRGLREIVFVYKQVFGVALGDFGRIERADKPERLPTVMSRQEVSRVLAAMTGTRQLMAKLLYECGPRLKECLRLRVKDVDFEHNQIVVRDGKGKKEQFCDPLARSGL